MQTSQESLRNEQNSPDFCAVDSVSMSDSGNGRRITHEDIEVVQNLIERCLQQYMTRNEVINMLLQQARIEPDFTILVWQKLEEENADFFKAYYARIVLKKQIILFNQLIEHHYHLMKIPAPSKNPVIPIENGIQHMPVNSLPMGFSSLQQSSVPSESVVNLPGCHMVNGVPASVNFHQIQMDPGLESPTDPISAPPSIKSEMVFSPASVVSNDQYPFVPGLDGSAFESAYASHMTRLEGMKLGPDSGIDNSEESPLPYYHLPWTFGFSDLAADSANAEDHAQMGNYSGSDVLLDSPEENIVEEFFADTFPALNSQSEE
ncbi:hypothetical protein M5689_017987 [Euphorbia peplus]|nr:hypothetical protein M5689_017987 [Euphorbia peplus]